MTSIKFLQYRSLSEKPDHCLIGDFCKQILKHQPYMLD